MGYNLNLSSVLARRSQRSLLLLILLATSLIWLFDYFTGPRLSVAIFYLLPVGLASWYVSRRAGFVVAAICAVAWLFNDLSTNLSGDLSLIPLWNAGVRLAIFLLVAHISAALRRARARQEELITFVVHDLRSPLSNVLACLEMIRETSAPRGCDEIQPFVAMGLGSVDDTLILIDSLLDLARLENDQMPLDLQPVPLNPLLQEAIQKVGAIGAREHVHVEMHAADQDETVLADRALLVRVLVNLLGNALKFSPADSTITVEASKTDDRRLHIVISDRGRGMPREWHSKAFEKYKQVQARKEGAAVGSGLGLAFCRMAVEAQNGRIWLEDGQPTGTRVHLSLPPAPAKPMTDLRR